MRLWEPPELVQPAIEETFERLARPYLAFAIRSDVLLYQWWSANCRKSLEWLTRQARSRRLVFCTPPIRFKLWYCRQKVVATVVDGG